MTAEEWNGVESAKLNMTKESKGFAPGNFLTWFGLSLNPKVGNFQTVASLCEPRDTIHQWWDSKPQVLRFSKGGNVKNQKQLAHLFHLLWVEELSGKGKAFKKSVSRVKELLLENVLASHWKPRNLCTMRVRQNIMPSPITNASTTRRKLTWSGKRHRRQDSRFHTLVHTPRALLLVCCSSLWNSWRAWSFLHRHCRKSDKGEITDKRELHLRCGLDGVKDAVALGAHGRAAAYHRVVAKKTGRQKKIASPTTTNTHEYR